MVKIQITFTFWEIVSPVWPGYNGAWVARIQITFTFWKILIAVWSSYIGAWMARIQIAFAIEKFSHLCFWLLWLNWCLSDKVTLVPQWPGFKLQNSCMENSHLWPGYIGSEVARFKLQNSCMENSLTCGQVTLVPKWPGYISALVTRLHWCLSGQDSNCIHFYDCVNG